jgi:uncharacterized protein YmfQ (DUF2313 family)
MALVDSLIKLLPSGAAWPSAISTNLYKTVSLFAPSLQRFISWLSYAQTDTFPISSQDTLPDWYASFGIPNIGCPPLTPVQLRIQFLLRLQDCGGASVNYLIGYAQTMGYSITITELCVPRAGMATAGVSASYGPYADFTYIVTVADTTLSYFRVGTGRAGDPLSIGSNIAWLVYELNRIKLVGQQIEFVPPSVFDWLSEDGVDSLLLESGNDILLDP